ncbi:LamG domain-containing protein [Streptomyces sp. NPDC005805]|uniref:LamG domain-containing protein n=1 Tax=Streptomyces sp. NPDC005805 TaxID=3157068 RepID=UPI0033D7B73C
MGDNRKLTATTPKLTEGVLYRYRSWTRSYYNGGKSQLPGPSNASTTGWCYFTVDPTRPHPPRITFGSPYAECTPNACPSAGGPGKPGSFTFAPAAGEISGVKSYEYKLSTETTWKPKTGSTVTVSLTPPRAGTYMVQVRAYDALGRAGEEAHREFLVSPGPGPVGRWHFDEKSGVAKNSEAPGTHDATLSGSAVRDDRGRRGLITHDAEANPLPTPVTDKGMVLNGTTGHASTSGPVIEARSSFTVAAWVRVDPASTQTVGVISQTPQSAAPWAKKYSPFAITYGGRWSMRVHSTDGTFIREAMAPNTSPKGVWTHVAGVHDAATKKMRLYLNGDLAASADAGTTWNADGPLQFGRLMYGDAVTDHMKGSIDEAVVWQEALSSEQIRDEARAVTSEQFADVELVADWNAAAASATTVPDASSGYGRTLTLTGGAAVQDEEIVLDGVNDAAGTAGPVVDDTGSFTVTTLVSLDKEKLKGKSTGYTGQVLGQRTAGGSAWGFWFELTGTKTVLNDDFEEEVVPVGYWHFGRLENNGTFSSVRSTEEATIGSAVRLTGVFDAQEDVIRLYLNQNQDGDDTEFTAAAGNGDFAIGRGFTSGGWKHHLPSRVGEVRLWSGAMASAQQVETAVGG